MTTASSTSTLSSYSGCVLGFSQNVVTTEHDYLMLRSLSNDTLGLIYLHTKPVPLALGNVALMIAELIYVFSYAK